MGPNTVCPPNKRVLMRDRQQIQGGIDQQEVLGATCQNTATQPYVNNVWKSERMTTIVPTESYIPLREAKTSNVGKKKNFSYFILKMKN